jgi:hypothetical protein
MSTKLEKDEDWLHDLFAAVALAAIITNEGPEVETVNIEHQVNTALAYADIMMKAREG